MNTGTERPASDRGTKWGALRAGWVRILLALGTIAAMALASGAGHKWL